MLGKDELGCRAPFGLGRPPCLQWPALATTAYTRKRKKRMMQATCVRNDSEKPAFHRDRKTDKRQDSEKKKFSSELMMSRYGYTYPSIPMFHI